MNEKKLAQSPGLFTFVIVAPALWAILGLVVFIEKYLLRWPKPLWYPFFSDTSYTDFTIFQPQFAAFGTPQFWQPHGFPFTYPASAALAFEAFFSIPGGSHLQYFLLFIAASAVIAAIASGVALRRRGLEFDSALLLAGIALLSSYPFMFLFDRGNIEIVNWIFVSFAITAYWCERWKLAGALLGIAISLKIFPVVLLGLFLARKKYAAMLIAVGTAVGVDVASLALLGPTIKIAHQQISHGLRFFRDLYVYEFHFWEVPFDHSLFAVVKRIASVVHLADQAHLAIFARWYMPIVAAGALLIYFGRIIRLPRINQIVILLTLSILLPPVSGDYTLVHLYPGWLLLSFFAIEVETGVIRSRVLPACFFLLAFVFCPETYIVAGHHAHIAGSLKAVALSALVILLLVYPLEERSEDLGGNRSDHRRCA
ncbi:MAG: glycosyltransferase family 87 protein [Candidatus Sulfotelmatobacter sp.]